MANNIVRSPKVKAINYFPTGTRIDVVSWPVATPATTTSVVPGGTLLVMPFLAQYVQVFDAFDFISLSAANIVLGIYTYDPITVSGTLIAQTAQISTPSGNSQQTPSITPIRIYPGTYALGVHTSTNWSTLVGAGNGAGCGKILGGGYSGGQYQNWAYLSMPLAYSSTMPSNLSPSLSRSDSIFPPNPLMRCA